MVGLKFVRSPSCFTRLLYEAASSINSRVNRDAYGAMLLAALEGRASYEVIERDDGFISVNRLGGSSYLDSPADWIPAERDALRFMRGRTLDIGAGGGRISIALQGRGQDVVAIDSSPGAVEVCRRRGLRDVREMTIDDIGGSLGTVDTVVLFGNNFGLLASASKAKTLLRRFHELTTERGSIVAQSSNPYMTDDPMQLEYIERNRERGRMGGQMRIRVRFRAFATEWFDYLIVAPEEMNELFDASGWHLLHLVYTEGAGYIAVAEKE
jgi:SAM-dependent methyltransferase